MTREKGYKSISSTEENINAYTEFIPNPENNEYRKKFLGVKKKKFKK